MATQSKDLHELLEGLHDVWRNSKYLGEEIYRSLNKAANDVKVDDFIQFEISKEFSTAFNSSRAQVFHYGILVYDNYSLTSNTTLIPFKYAYSAQSQQDPQHDPLHGLSAAVDKSESNVRSFLFTNEDNANKVKGLGYDGYLLFSHDFGSTEAEWCVKTDTGLDIDLNDLEALWGPDNGMLNIFKRDFFNYNNVNQGQIYTAIKIVDFDVEGRSSSYLIVNSDSKDLIEKFIHNGDSQKRIYLLVSAVRSLYTQIHSDLQRKESIKSAKAAIMSRNISHNLGSHVMAYMKQDLSSVEDMLKKGVLRTALPCEGVSMAGKEIPYLVGVGKFLSYLQERQDYIATVSTDYIPYPSVVNFKDAIYDELNPDYRFKRHTEWKGHQPANILLENIAKSEGLSRKTLEKDEKRQESDNIVIQYGKFNGLNHKDCDAIDDYNNLRKWYFSLPGGIMGRQAIFSIVENVIRNAAKHSSRETGNDLVLTFDILDPMTDAVDDSEYSKAKDIRDLYIVKLTTNTIVSKKALEKIKNALIDTLVEDNGQLKQSNKGIKEMLISAAWLRGIKIEDLNEKQINEKAPILRACKTTEGELQYVFCLPKVKDVAMITEQLKEADLQKDIIKLMHQKGWYLFSVDDYLRFPNKDFSFVIIDPEICKDSDNQINAEELKIIKERIKQKSHNRFFVAAGNTDLNKHTIETSLFKKFLGFKAESDFDQSLLDLYKQMAGYSEDDKIAIADKDFDESKNKFKEHITVLSSDEIDQDYTTYKYIYRKHNDSESEFGQLATKFGSYQFCHNLKFVEGITGGNSTDRLVRHMVLDPLWFYKQIHAMKTRVAIFDERIFTKVTGYEMTDLIDLTSTSESKKWTFEDLTVEEAKKQMYKHDKERKKIIKNEIFKEWKSLSTMEEIRKFANKYFPLQRSAEKKFDSLSSMVFHKKRIDVFTITWKVGGIFDIWGFIPGEKWKEGGPYGEIKTVGQLIIYPKGEKDPVVTLIRDVDMPKFDYLSIHQGLLDKVYEQFSVDDDEKKMSTMKKGVTKALHVQFMASSGDDDYLQGLIIHSGRSKPNEENMPQHQPFVQYSAIENAVFDCKYTLVDLLDFACFE